jgi:hypothetical protein
VLFLLRTMLSSFPTKVAAKPAAATAQPVSCSGGIWERFTDGYLTWEMVMAYRSAVSMFRDAPDSWYRAGCTMSPAVRL